MYPFLIHPRNKDSLKIKTTTTFTELTSMRNDWTAKVLTLRTRGV